MMTLSNWAHVCVVSYVKSRGKISIRKPVLHSILVINSSSDKWCFKQILELKCLYVHLSNHTKLCCFLLTSRKCMHVYVFLSTMSLCINNLNTHLMIFQHLFEQNIWNWKGSTVVILSNKIITFWNFNLF